MMKKNNTKQGGKMIFKNKKKKLSFEERMELALTKTKFTKKQKDIVRTWY